MKKKFITLFALLPLLLIFVALPVYAQGVGKSGSNTSGIGKSGSDTKGQGESITIDIPLKNPLKGIDSVNSFLVVVLDSLVFLLTPFVVIMLLWSGFQFIIARGDPGKLKKAREGLLYTVIGALIILGAKGFSLAIAGTITELGKAA